MEIAQQASSTNRVDLSLCTFGKRRTFKEEEIFKFVKRATQLFYSLFYGKII